MYFFSAVYEIKYFRNIKLTNWDDPSKRELLWKIVTSTIKKQRNKIKALSSKARRYKILVQKWRAYKTRLLKLDSSMIDDFEDVDDESDDDYH